RHVAALGRAPQFFFSRRLSAESRFAKHELILDEYVVSSSTIQHILPRAADQNVVTGSAQQSVYPGAAHKHIRTFSTVGCESDHARTESGCANRVVSAKCIDRQLVDGIDAGDCYRRPKTGNTDVARRSVHHDCFRLIRAVD